jgi:hypothetical protein
VSVLSTAGRSEHLVALVRSSAELSTLSRNVRHLADLLRNSDFAAAREYRGLLDSLSSDIARHLETSGRVIAALSPSHHRRTALRDLARQDRSAL